MKDPDVVARYWQISDQAWFYDSKNIPPSLLSRMTQIEASHFIQNLDLIMITPIVCLQKEL